MRYELDAYGDLSGVAIEPVQMVKRPEPARQPLFGTTEELREAARQSGCLEGFAAPGCTLNLDGLPVS